MSSPITIIPAMTPLRSGQLIGLAGGGDGGDVGVGGIGAGGASVGGASLTVNIPDRPPTFTV